MQWFRSSPPGDPLAVTMSGVKLGDRLLVIGCEPARLVAQLALKPGLTGRACAVDEREARSARAAESALKEGALLESETGPYSALKFQNGSFDLVVVNHIMDSTPAGQLPAVSSEVRRVLRDGGRCVWIERSRRPGLFPRTTSPDRGSVEQALTAAGFRAVRTLAEREGLMFVEGARRD